MASETTRAKGRVKIRGKTQDKTPAVTTGMNSQPQQHREQVSLVYRYGSIGIEAVAAAARYAGEPKKSDTPGVLRIDPRFLENAV
jgi:hypothetical protein